MIGNTHTHDDRLTRRAHMGGGATSEDHNVRQPVHADPGVRVDGAFHRPMPLMAAADAEHASGYDAVYGWY